MIPQTEEVLAARIENFHCFKCSNGYTGRPASQSYPASLFVQCDKSNVDIANLADVEEAHKWPCEMWPDTDDGF